MRNKNGYKDFRDAVNTNSINYFNRGGYYNAGAGVGTSNDKNYHSTFVPTILTSRYFYEIMRAESWAARRFIELIVDDCFQKQRVFKGLSSDQINYYQEYWEDYNVDDKLIKLFGGGRLYGSAFLVILTKENDLTQPLDLNYLRQGDLCNLLVVDRFSIWFNDYNTNPMNKNYLKPEVYRVISRTEGEFNIHSSRVIRFDGIQSYDDNGWTASYDWRYGISELNAVLQGIFNFAGSRDAIGQLIFEASIPVLKIADFKETLTRAAADNTDVEKMLEDINQKKSIYKQMVMDVEDEFSRENITFAGIADILNVSARLLAAEGGYPATYFLSQSPDGMNSTGISDMKHYAAKVATFQRTKIRRALNKLDSILQITSGMRTPFTYSFPPFVQMTEKEKSEIAQLDSTTVVNLTSNNILTENEARKILTTNSNDFFGDLDPLDTNLNVSLNNDGG